MCPCGLEDQWDSSLHQEDCGQQVERGDPPLLRRSGEATPGIVCAVRGSPVQEGHRMSREGPA